MSLVRRVAQTAFVVADTFQRRLRGPRILIYHQVGSGQSHEMNVTVDAFRRQIDWLEAHGEIVSLEEGCQRREGSDAEHLYVLTFDDGYADVFTNAYPLLEQRRVPFTLYLTSGPTEAPGDFPDWPGTPLTWEQIAIMHGSGLMTLGAHTHTHTDLRHVDLVTATEEIELSNRLIEQRLGELPEHFTYPKGWWSETADPAVRNAYSSATLGMGASITSGSDLYTLNRVPVLASDTLWAFRRKMLTGGRTENRVRRLRHHYTGP
ncbi:MAG: polysaccharide deacetylase family protein [Acidimicrobiia bacterium]